MVKTIPNVINLINNITNQMGNENKINLNNTLPKSCINYQKI